MIEENRVVEMLGTLPTDPGGQPRLDVGHAIRTGRRRTMRNRAVAATGVLAVTAAVAVGVPLVISPHTPQRPAEVTAPALHPVAPKTPLTQVTTCVPELLPLPPNAKTSSVSATDPTGTYQVGKAGGYPAIWKDGKFAATVKATGDNPALQAVNSSGIAVGYSGIAVGFTDSTTRAGYAAWAYADGTLYPLKAATPAVVAGIDEQGRAAGTRLDGETSRGVVWDSVTATATDLPLPEGYVQSSVSGVFSDGTVFGEIATEEDMLNNPPGRATLPLYGDQYLWAPDHKSGKLLPMPQGTKKLAGVHPGDGWVWGWTKGGIRYNVRADRWSTFSNKLVQPQTINALGWVGGGDERTGELFLDDGHRMITLPTGDSVVNEDARVLAALSADGRLLAGTLGTAAVWHCN